MGEHNKPILVKCWQKFLEYKKCKHTRTTASHHIWKCKGVNRSIVFRGAKKEIPRFHINTNLKTMGIDKETFNKWIKNNC